MELHYHRQFKNYFDKGYSTLTIKNNTEYLDYVINEPYESQLVISDYLIIDHPDLIKIDYTCNSKIKRCPPKIKEKFQDTPTIIWTDDINHKIGFTSNDRAIVFDKNQIKCLSITNTETTRRNNESSLTIYFIDKNEEAITIFLAEHNFLSQYVDKIKALTDKEVLYIEQYIDNV